jgi:prevent-host-death family protein
MQTWQLQEAKNRLSEVVRHAHQGPQLITLRGKEEAVVLSFDEYQKLTQPRKTWVELLGEMAQSGIELDLGRSRDTGRNIEL